MPRESVFATCQSRWISCKIRKALRRCSNLNAVESSAKHDFNAEPYRTDKTGDDYCNDRLECVALRVLDAFAPPSQVLEVRAQLDSVDEFNGAFVAILDCLRRLAPTTVQNGVGRGYPRSGRCIV